MALVMGWLLWAGRWKWLPAALPPDVWAPSGRPRLRAAGSARWAVGGESKRRPEEDGRRLAWGAGAGGRRSRATGGSDDRDASRRPRRSRRAVALGGVIAGAGVGGPDIGERRHRP